MRLNLEFNCSNHELTFATDERIQVNVPDATFASGQLTPLQTTNAPLPIPHGLGRVPKLYWIWSDAGNLAHDRFYAGQLYNTALQYGDKTILAPVFYYNTNQSTPTISWYSIPEAYFPTNQYIYITPNSNAVKAGVTYKWGAVYWDD